MIFKMPMKNKEDNYFPPYRNKNIQKKIMGNQLRKKIKKINI